MGEANLTHGSPIVVLTRSVVDNAALAHRLQAAGARVLELPTVAMAFVAPSQPPDELTELLRRAPAVAFTSRYGVKAWLDQQGPHGLSAALRRGAEVAVVGQGTAQALVEAGVSPSLIADPATGAALAAQLLARLSHADPAPVLAIGGRHTRPELAQGLRAGGRAVRAVTVYENRAPAAPATDLLIQAEAAVAIYIAAPSAADRLLAWHPPLRDRAFVAIGPTTAAALAEHHGIVVAAVAESPGIAAVEAAILRTLFGSSP